MQDEQLSGVVHFHGDAISWGNSDQEERTEDSCLNFAVKVSFLLK